MAMCMVSASATATMAATASTPRFMSPNPKYDTPMMAANTTTASTMENSTAPLFVAFEGTNGAAAGSMRAVSPRVRVEPVRSMVLFIASSMQVGNAGVGS